MPTSADETNLLVILFLVEQDTKNLCILLKHCAFIGLEFGRWMIDCKLTFVFTRIRLEFLPDFGLHWLSFVMRLVALIFLVWYLYENPLAIGWLVESCY